MNGGLRCGFLSSSPTLTPLLLFSGSAGHSRFSWISGKWRGLVSCAPWRLLGLAVLNFRQGRPSNCFCHSTFPSVRTLICSLSWRVTEESSPALGYSAGGDRDTNTELQGWQTGQAVKPQDPGPWGR